MDRIFYVGLLVGITSRLIMLKLDQKQYPTQPNVLLSQLVLAFIASALGALVVPALGARSYTSITFLSLAAEQFRQVRENRRDTLQNLEDTQLVQRGEAFIEDVARTYEIRNYMCIVTSLLTVVLHVYLIGEFGIPRNASLMISGIGGIALAFLFRKLLTRKSIGDIADIVPVEITFENGFIMKVGDLSGITNVGSELDRSRYLTHGVGIEIIPKDNDYTNAGTILDPGQRQAIIYNIYSRVGLFRQEDEPAFYPLPRRNPKKESLVIAYLPMEKDIDKVIEGAKSCPILASARGKNIALKNHKIGQEGSVQ